MLAGRSTTKALLIHPACQANPHGYPRRALWEPDAPFRKNERRRDPKHMYADFINSGLLVD